MRIILIVYIILGNYCISSIDIKCEFKDYSVDGYNCQVTNLNIEDESTAMVDSINGKHRPGKSNDNVVVLYIASFHSNCIKHIPTGVGNLFKNLKKIQVIEVPLTIISSIDFVGINLLRIIEIRKTFLSLLPEDTFDNLLTLEILNLNDNRIQELKSKTFQNLINLKKVLLAGNMMTSLPLELFVVNVKLEEIDLSANRLKLVDDSIFDSLNNSTKISMADNFCIVENSPLNLLKVEIAGKCRHDIEIVNKSSLTNTREEIQKLQAENGDVNEKLQRAYNDIKYLKRIYDELQGNFTKIDETFRRTLEMERSENEITQRNSESSRNVIKAAFVSSSLILVATLIIFIIIVTLLGIIIRKQRKKLKVHEQAESLAEMTNWNVHFLET